MIDGIIVRVLGDFGPFSRIGKSIGYQIEIGQSIYLIDCGAPLFQQIGGHGLQKINGLIITHCHEDHKRWFSDLALFNMYAADITHKVSLITSENVHNDIIEASMPSLGKSLSNDSKKVVDIAYEEYIKCQVIGPKTRYQIVQKDEGMGKSSLYITDKSGNTIGPDKAKIIISQKTNRLRMLFYDQEYKEWVEPESFYAFSSSVFYEEEQNNFIGEDGFTIEAIKAPVWHGLAGIGIRVKTKKETLVFSSDTVNDIDLWKQLYSEKRSMRFKISKKEFESAAVIYGDINDYIERTWSEERFNEAVNAFNGAVVIHDVSEKNSIVHTEYNKIKNTKLLKNATILTHSPDNFTSEWMLCSSEKAFKIKGKKIFELVGNKLYSMNADLYHKEGGKYYVGYKNKKGKYTVCEKDGILQFSSDRKLNVGKPIYSVDLYEDISGKYFPRIEEKNSFYFERKDGKVELVKLTKEGSRGTPQKSHRDRLNSARKIK